MITVTVCYTKEQSFYKAFITASAYSVMLYSDLSYYSSIYLLQRQTDRVLKGLKIKAYWIRQEQDNQTTTITYLERKQIS